MAAQTITEAMTSTKGSGITAVSKIVPFGTVDATDQRKKALCVNQALLSQLSDEASSLTNGITNQPQPPVISSDKLMEEMVNMLLGILANLSHLTQVNAGDMQNQAQISTVVSNVTKTQTDDFIQKIKEYAAQQAKAHVTNLLLKIFGGIAIGLSLIYTAVTCGAGAFMAIAAITAMTQAGLFNDNGAIGKLFGGISSDWVRGLVKFVCVTALTVALTAGAGAIDSIVFKAAATETAATTAETAATTAETAATRAEAVGDATAADLRAQATEARAIATQLRANADKVAGQVQFSKSMTKQMVAMQSLVAVNPTEDFCQGTAALVDPKGDKDKQKMISQIVSTVINVLLSLAAMKGMSSAGAPQLSLLSERMTAVMPQLQKLLLLSNAMQGAFQIWAGKVSIDTGNVIKEMGEAQGNIQLMNGTAEMSSNGIAAAQQHSKAVTTEYGTAVSISTHYNDAERALSEALLKG